MTGRAEDFSLPTSAATARSDALAQIDRTAAHFQGFHAFLDQCIGQNDGGRGAVAGNLIGLHRHFPHDLRTHIFKPVEQFNFGCDADTVTGNQWRPDRPVDHGIHPLGTKGRLDCGGKLGDASGQSAPCINIVQH